MKALKPVGTKKSGKHDREQKVLIGLIEYYLKTGKPVGSNTLKEAGFGDLSSATIRNYFAHLEDEGYLVQQHSSGGRIPTNSAFRLYAQEHVNTPFTAQEDEEIKKLRRSDTREIAAYLQEAADTLSRLSQSAVFLSAPRFDHDLVTDLKLVPIDHLRTLAVIVTDFGVIQTEILNIDRKLTAHAAKRIEGYFAWRLNGHLKPENMDPEEEALAKQLYNEIMVRYIVGYSNFTDEEIHRTGFSKLLAYPEFHDPQTLANSLSLFENGHSMRLILKECAKKKNLHFWVGEDLANYARQTPDCAVIAAPYHIGQQTAGAIGILGPVRMPYKELFGLMRQFSSAISEALTRNIYKFKISVRQPAGDGLFISQNRTMLLEDKS